MTYYENLGSDEAVRLETLKLTANPGDMDGWLANAQRAADYVLGEPERTYHQDQATKVHAVVRRYLDTSGRPAALDAQTPVLVEDLRQVLNVLAWYARSEEPPF